MCVLSALEKEYENKNKYMGYQLQGLQFQALRNVHNSKFF